MGDSSQPSWTLRHKHIAYIDGRLDSLYHTAVSEDARHEFATAACANLLAWLGWLRGGELFGICIPDLSITLPAQGPTLGLPPGVGVIQVRLAAETKSNPTCTADVIAAHMCGSGLSLGKWLGRLLPHAHNHLLFSTRNRRWWNSSYFCHEYAFPLLEAMRSDGEPTLQVFSDVEGNRICNKVCIAIRGQERRNALYMGARIQNGSHMHRSTSSSLNNATSKVVDGNRKEDVTASVGSSNIADGEQPEASVFMDKFPMENKPIQQSPANPGVKPASIDQKRIQASRITAIQCGLYCFFALFAAIFGFLPWVGWKIGAPTKVRVSYTFMSGVFPHLQGFFNLFIFVRLQYNHLRETEKEWSRLKCIIHCLTSPAANK
jgi:hypothetical protein